MRVRKGGRERDVHFIVQCQSGNFHYKTGFSAKIEHAYSHQVVNEYGEGSRPGKAQEAS
jgi:hypothetical protein